MAGSGVCLGHEQRLARRNKINNLLITPTHSIDENLRVLIKKGPVSEEISLGDKLLIRRVLCDPVAVQCSS